MTRRAFVFGLAALVACLGSFGLASAADAQQPASPRRIGVLLVAFSPESKEAQAFRQGLRDAGYAEGRDVVIEWRSANGDYARVPELVADLVQRKVDVIVVDSTVCGPCREARHVHHPDRHGDRRRSSRIWLGREPRASWRQRHRALDHD